MSEKDVLLGLDIGTQSTKGILYNAITHTIVARATSSYPLDDIRQDAPKGRAEQHPLKWIKALHVIFSNFSIIIRERGYTVIGVGVSGQQHGMVALNEKFDVIRSAKLWCDVEANKEAIQFSKDASEVLKDLNEKRKQRRATIHKRQKLDDNEDLDGSSDWSNWSIPAGFTVPKVIWMKKNEPELWKKVRWIILPHDYINLCLRAGFGSYLKAHESKTESFSIDGITPTTDAGDASGSGILDPLTQEYLPELAQLVDPNYSSMLPQILPPNAICGKLSPSWSRILLGTYDKSADDIVISAGSGDNMCSALGTACTTPGKAVLSLGTSGTIFGISSSPVQTGTTVAPFCDASGHYLPLVCTMSCTSVLESVLETYGGQDGTKKRTSHEDATLAAQKVEAGCSGLTFLPYLGGERTPDWPHATGALLGITAKNMKLMSKNVCGYTYRAALEGITFGLKDALTQMEEACSVDGKEGFSPKEIMVVGGGAKNKFWRQMISDVLGVSLRFPLEPESAALGAAFQAGAAVSGLSITEYIDMQKTKIEDIIVRPSTNKMTTEMYQQAFQRYIESSRKLFATAP